MNEEQKFAAFKRFHDKEDIVEEVIREFYTSFLSKNTSIAIDGGSHKGFHTLPLTQCCKHVVGIDANADMCAALQSQLHTAKISNCSIFHAALQDDENLSNVTFYVSEKFLGRSSLTRLWNAIDSNVTYHPVTVPATTLDRLSDQLQLDSVDFIKLDLEGGEYRALLGARRILARHRPLLVMENSIHAAKQGGFAETDPFDFLTREGYILVAPDGSTVRRDRLFPFWYVFGIPSEKLSRYGAAVSDAYRKVCEQYCVW